jgi:hypothetical protein
MIHKVLTMIRLRNDMSHKDEEGKEVVEGKGAGAMIQKRMHYWHTTQLLLMCKSAHVQSSLLNLFHCLNWCSDDR